MIFNNEETVNSIAKGIEHNQQKYCKDELLSDESIKLCSIFLPEMEKKDSSKLKQNNIKDQRGFLGHKVSWFRLQFKIFLSSTLFCLL